MKTIRNRNVKIKHYTGDYKLKNLYNPFSTNIKFKKLFIYSKLLFFINVLKYAIYLGSNIYKNIVILGFYF